MGRANVLVRLRALVNAWKPEVIHSYLEVPNLIAAPGRSLTPARAVWGQRNSGIESQHAGRRDPKRNRYRFFFESTTTGVRNSVKSGARAASRRRIEAQFGLNVMVDATERALQSVSLGEMR